MQGINAIRFITSAARELEAIKAAHCMVSDFEEANVYAQKALGFTRALQLFVREMEKAKTNFEECVQFTDTIYLWEIEIYENLIRFGESFDESETTMSKLREECDHRKRMIGMEE